MPSSLPVFYISFFLKALSLISYTLTLSAETKVLLILSTTGSVCLLLDYTADDESLASKVHVIAIITHGRTHAITEQLCRPENTDHYRY